MPQQTRRSLILSGALLLVRCEALAAPRAELWPQISFAVRKSIALIDHFSLSNMRPLIDRRFKCSACDLMFVSLWLFVTRDKADAWATNTALVNR